MPCRRRVAVVVQVEKNINVGYANALRPISNPKATKMEA